jgi:hypothetical protein
LVDPSSEYSTQVATVTVLASIGATLSGIPALGWIALFTALSSAANARVRGRDEEAPSAVMIAMAALSVVMATLASAR